jgi:hypothetical protein
MDFFLAHNWNRRKLAFSSKMVDRAPFKQRWLTSLNESFCVFGVGLVISYPPNDAVLFILKYLDRHVYRTLTGNCNDILLVFSATYRNAWSRNHLTYFSMAKA